MTRPRRFTDAGDCAEFLIERLGGRIRLAVPLGLGKPAVLVNELYRRARERPELQLEIFTALTLEIPKPGSDLEARLLGPVVERLYAGVPALDYAADHRRGRLPGNVRITEFYLRPGASLGNPDAQRRYVSSNYTHAARDLAARGVNVIAQMISPQRDEKGYSLSCNPDLTRDLLREAERLGGAAPLLVGEVNPRLPHFGAGARLDAGELDAVIEADASGYELFPVPNRPVTLADHVIGLRVAALVRDGGTLQLGIGSLADAVVHALVLRRTDNARFRALLDALAVTTPAPLVDELPEGLYGASEMFVEGFLELREAGVLTRCVDGGVWLHAAFFLGSAAFYERLRRLPDAERAGVDMTRVSFTNDLYGGEADKRRQRVHARFVNSAMKVTLLGAAASDALEDGRVVSGVGGQYNFVAMAHELDGGRSILVLPATRTAGGAAESNIVWRYGHTTIPRHLRDLVVTEYGVADLRGRSDQDVIVALLNLADSRFQERLRRQAVAAGKLDRRYRIPERFRRNRPERLAARLADPWLLGALPWYPLGTDFTTVEAELAVALAGLAEHRGSRLALLRLARAGWHRGGEDRLRAALERMGLARPRGVRERVLRALLAAALERRVHARPRPLLPARPVDKATSL